jgi:hypothetical protein
VVAEFDPYKLSPTYDFLVGNSEQVEWSDAALTTHTCPPIVLFGHRVR